jgi:hypothetical protein
MPLVQLKRHCWLRLRRHAFSDTPSRVKINRTELSDSVKERTRYYDCRECGWVSVVHDRVRYETEEDARSRRPPDPPAMRLIKGG